MVTAHDVLTRGKDLLTEYGWAKGSHARDENGNRVYVAHPNASSFCAIGALARACQDFGSWEPYATAINTLMRQAGMRAMAEWNDTSTLDEVLDAYDRAIAATRSDDDDDGGSRIRERDLVLV